jgi:hypothetical protein
MTSSARSEIIVTPFTAPEETTTNYVVGAGKYLILPLPGPGDASDSFMITVNADNAIYKDVTAYLVDDDNMRLFTQGAQYQGIGYQKGVAPFTIKGSTQKPGSHYLILDNSYALFVAKKLSVSIKAAYPMSDADQQLFKTQYSNLYGLLKRGFIFPDFNIRIQPCGQVNAFSDSFTSGDIHMCTEMVDHLAKTNNTGAAMFIFFHELGHSLLGLWGMPGNNNEDIADEFATYIMLMGGSASVPLLNQSLEYWRSLDSGAEARYIIERGDRHSLSIQRIRNIQENMARGDLFLKRWHRELYPHMTTNALNEIVKSPHADSDVELAQSIIKQRNVAN